MKDDSVMTYPHTWLQIEMNPGRKCAVSFSGERGNYRDTINSHLINAHCFHLREHCGLTLGFVGVRVGRRNYSDMHEGSTIEPKQNWISESRLIRDYKSWWHLSQGQQDCRKQQDVFLWWFIKERAVGLKTGSYSKRKQWAELWKVNINPFNFWMRTALCSDGRGSLFKCGILKNIVEIQLLVFQLLLFLLTFVHVPLQSCCVIQPYYTFHLWWHALRVWFTSSGDSGWKRNLFPLAEGCKPLMEF